MANFKLTQTGEQIQADLDLLDKNSATDGQVLTANGTGGATWQAPSGGGGASIGGGFTLTLDSTFADFASAVPQLFILGGKITPVVSGGPTVIEQDFFGLHDTNQMSEYYKSVPCVCENAIAIITPYSGPKLKTREVNSMYAASGTAYTSATAYKVYFLAKNTTLWYED